MDTEKKAQFTSQRSRDLPQPRHDFAIEEAVVQREMKASTPRNWSVRPVGTVPPIDIPFFEAAILSLFLSPVTSRSNCANKSRTLSVSCRLEVVVLNRWVTSLALDERRARFALRMQGVEILFKTFIGANPPQ